MGQCKFINCNKCITVANNIDNGGLCMLGEGQQTVYGKSLYFAFNFVMNLKLL